MEEKDFEKKPTKKTGLIIGIVILAIILLIAGGGYAYLKISTRPEKIFNKLISKPLKINEDVRSTRIELNLAASVNSDNEEIKKMIEGIKLKSTTEIDLDNKIFNQNLNALYVDDSVIDMDVLVEDKNLYLYSKDLFSKYVKIPEEELDDLGEVINSLFEENKIDFQALEQDIKQVLKDELKPERLNQEKVKLNGKRTTKSTLRLTSNEYLQVINKVLKEIYKYDKSEFIKDIIDQLDSLKDYEEEIGYIDISVYTQGLIAKVVKADIAYTNTMDEQLTYIEYNIETKNKFEVRWLQNEESTKLEGAKEIFTLKIHKEDEYKGTIKLKLNIDEESSVILKLDFKEEVNPTIEKRDVSNSVNMNELTDEDYMEIYENVQKNEILYYAILNFMFNTNVEEETDIVEDDYYNYNEESEYLNEVIENNVL